MSVECIGFGLVRFSGCTQLQFTSVGSPMQSACFMEVRTSFLVAIELPLDWSIKILFGKCQSVVRGIDVDYERTTFQKCAL